MSKKLDELFARDEAGAQILCDDKDLGEAWHAFADGSGTVYGWGTQDEAEEYRRQYLNDGIDDELRWHSASRVSQSERLELGLDAWDGTEAFNLSDALIAAQYEAEAA